MASWRRSTGSCQPKLRADPMTRWVRFPPSSSCLCRSLSYVTAVGCLSFLLLGAMFFIIDVKGWWRGQPFLYPGMNSIFVYVGHSLLGFYFPFSWEIGFQQSHWELLLQNLWGTGLWVLIAFLLYRKKFFLKI